MFGFARRVIEMITGNRWLLLVVMLINAAGFFIGLYYYWDQIRMTPWYLWLAVPDCPLYALFMAVAIGLILIGKPWKTFNAITAVGASMYGVWTIVVLLYFGEFFFSSAYAEGSWVRLISHGGLALEGFLLLPYLTEAKTVPWVITALWFGVLDSWDYFYYFAYDGLPIRTHPLAVMEYYRVVSQAKVDTLVYITFGLTAIFFIAVVALTRWYDDKPQKKNSIEKEIRT